MIISVGFMVALILGGKQVIAGTLNIGVYSSLVFMTQRLLWPFTDVARMLKQFEKDMTCARRVFMLIDGKEEECGTEKKKEIALFKGEISFEHVDFTYPNGYEVFKDFNLSVPAGQTIGFVGETGSGKSTIIKLLLRLYEVNNGIIKIDGKAITDMSCHNLRKQIGLVSQESFLFSGTIAENISYGTFNAPREEIIKAAQYAEIHEFIQDLPEGYDTVIGEHGATLSGGQRQRISLARAILKNAPIYIFDEATSALDNETEVEIQKSLEKVSANHTTIVIAHRLSTVRNADVIYVLDQGNIIESGSHEELVAQNGTYAHLWNIQIGQTK
jgi:ATP-binding cassette subfamily B protein